MFVEDERDIRGRLLVYSGRRNDTDSPLVSFWREEKEK